METTDVMFRVSKNEPTDVYALFPAIAGTREMGTCLCYQHLGQHGAADMALCIGNSRPAKPAEYRALKKELQAVGYKLKIVKRSTFRHAQLRAGK